MTPHGGRRPGSGRKPVLLEPRKLTINLDRETTARLAAWCRCLGLTRGETIRYLISRTPEPPGSERKSKK